MIKKLTKAQEKQIPRYVEKWLKIGLSTDRINKKEAIKICHRIYKEILNKPEAPIVVLDGPIHAWIAVCMLSQKPEQVRSQVESQVRSQVRSFHWPYLYGNYDAGYFSFYDFMSEVMKIKYDCKAKYDLYKETTRLGLIYPLDNICIVSEKPSIINIKNGRLHCENGPSVAYKDGLEVYSLNGIKVPKEIVMTPAKEFTKEMILNEQNADIRREIIKKIGIERSIKLLGAKTLDKFGDYELLKIEMGREDRKRVYLRMKNPSIDAYHIEGCPPECKTVKAALCFRNGLTEWNEPFALT